MQSCKSDLSGEEYQANGNCIVATQFLPPVRRCIDCNCLLLLPRDCLLATADLAIFSYVW